MFNAWLQQLLEQPRIFCQWFKYQRYEADLYRSTYVVFDLILNAPMDILIHPDYVEVFVAPDDDDNHVLRVARRTLTAEENGVFEGLERHWRGAFSRWESIPSGKKTVFWKFKHGPITIDRVHLATAVCSHLLSCLPPVGTLKLLCRVARVLSPLTLYPQLRSDELYAKLMAATTSLRCADCGRILGKNVVPGSWATRFANIYAFADQLAVAHRDVNPHLPHMYRLHGCKQYLLNALVEFEHPDREPELQAVVDRFVLGHPPASTFVMPPPPTAPPARLVVAPQEDRGKAYGGPVPDGVPVWHTCPLSIYPPGQYGGDTCVVLSAEDRAWQLSYMVFQAATRVITRGEQFVPLAAALWAMIDEGDLEMLTRILQCWTAGNKSRLDKVVPERCLVRAHWQSLRDLAADFKTAWITMRECVEHIHVAFRNFVSPKQRFYGKEPVDDAFWARALATCDADRILDQTQQPKTPEPRMDPVKFRRTTLRQGWQESEAIFCSEDGSVVYGYSTYVAPPTVHPLLHFFFEAECARRGGATMYAVKELQPDHCLEKAWITVLGPGHKYVPVKLSRLTVLTDHELPHALPPIVAQPKFTPCPGGHVRRRLTAAAATAAPRPSSIPRPIDPDIARRRAEARAALQAQADEAEQNGAFGWHLVVRHDTLRTLSGFLTDAGLDMVAGSADGAAIEDTQGRRYTVDKTTFTVDGLHTFPFTADGARSWALIVLHAVLLD